MMRFAVALAAWMVHAAVPAQQIEERSTFAVPEQRSKLFKTEADLEVEAAAKAAD